MELGGIPEKMDDFFSLGTYFLCKQFCKEFDLFHV